ncbi:putative ABC transport system permease protein [Tamilnaduibacter salinus]|uniref:Peptide ABC transporter permease n=1 Tax=Tamilnaduibacter salinus TaxID=1484056 RepID=A0A2A2I317_9GAMM|nr:ABC transporter permease [Tamilnaduibacter salinus]PAV25525.1 peptide ABC transporter permease [Tamilnaduibacter salinus]PVY77353.1 putative ABC transport system permease protein [Tamilnaduibacter salinus]
MMVRTTIRLALASLWHRRGTLSLVVLTLTLSVSLLLGVQYLRTEVKQSFVSTISGTDLIVGARSSPLNLLLYSVFHVGNATNNVRWSTYQAIRQNDAVDWMVPMSLGDSHKGHRVVGTTTGFFEHFEYGQAQQLTISPGRPFSDVFDVVIGADVAREHDYQLGDEIILSHGTGSTSFVEHDDKPFTVVGVLDPTGTPVDNALYVSLEAIEAIHLGWQAGVPVPGQTTSAEQARQADLTPGEITAALVGVKRKVLTFRLQRTWNQWHDEPLTAILPGVALSRLWQLLDGFETALLAITGFVVATSLVGMTAVLLTTQAHRRREMAVLRAIGAPPGLIAALFSIESVLIAMVSVALALGASYGGLTLMMPLIEAQLGLRLSLRPLSAVEWGLLGAVPLCALLISLVPALRAYRRSLIDGLMPRE